MGEQAGGGAVGELLEGKMNLRLELSKGSGVLGEEIGPELLLLGQRSVDLLEGLLQGRNLLAGLGAKAELHG